MSQATCRPRINLDLSAQEFKLLIRCLSGTISEAGEFANAREFGLQLMDQYVRSEKERVRQLSGVLGRLQNAQEPEEAPEVPEQPPAIPVTILRPTGMPLVRRAHR